MKTLYVDMDGVLSDFDTFYHSRFGKLPSKVRQDKVPGEYSSYWNALIDERGFEKLPLFPGASKLLEFLDDLNHKQVNIALLTSTAGFDRHNDVQNQKLNWLKQHNIIYPAVVVPGKRFKKGYASKTSFLIDDTEVNVKDFIDAGGSGVVHYYPDPTIKAVTEWL